MTFFIVNLFPLIVIYRFVVFLNRFVKGGGVKGGFQEETRSGRYKEERRC